MRGKVRNPATAVTHWPAADQAGQPIRAAIAKVVDTTPPAHHAPTHQSGGTDPLSVTTLAGFPGGLNYLGADAAFHALGAGAPHATTHQDGGADEISVTGLSGQLADPQKPLQAPILTRVSFRG